MNPIQTPAFFLRELVKCPQHLVYYCQRIATREEWKTLKRNYNFLAFDFGASSGRAMLGAFDGERVEIRELHRFLNEPVELAGRFTWDVPRLFFEMKHALNKAAKEGLQIDAIGIDTWGVDFGLIDKNGHLLGLPVHYRDHRTDGMMEKAFEVMPKEELFRHTGIGFTQYNTLYQLFLGLIDAHV